MKEQAVAQRLTVGGFPGSLSLSSAVKGIRLIVTGVPEGRARTQLIRLGIMEGEEIRCIERLPGGTVVIEKSRQEIAIGAALAETILIEPAGAEEDSRSC
jgi:Fe2+ transport system protein FeoA